jgi:uncharacterized protein (DUF2249 family)
MEPVDDDRLRPRVHGCEVRHKSFKMNNNNTTSPVDNNKVMDVRPIPCSIKHGLILKTWRDLAVGDYFILLNDHDPVPLRYQFQAEFPGMCQWEYLEQGPEDFRVRITKLKVTSENHVHESPSVYGCSAQHN